MASMEEQETTVTQLRNGGTSIYSANPVHIRKLEKEPRAERVKVWMEDGRIDAAQYEIAAGDFDPLKGFKQRRRPLTEEERAKRAETFRQNMLKN